MTIDRLLVFVVRFRYYREVHENWPDPLHACHWMIDGALFRRHGLLPGRIVCSMRTLCRRYMSAREFYTTW